jgi:hypothetical protein
MEECERLDGRSEFMAILAKGKACEIAYTKLVSGNDDTSIRIANGRMVCVSKNEKTISSREKLLDCFEQKPGLRHTLVGAQAKDSKAHRQIS